MEWNHGDQEDTAQDSGLCELLSLKNFGNLLKGESKNRDLMEFTGKELIVSQIVRRKWIGHNL